MSRVCGEDVDEHCHRCSNADTCTSSIADGTSAATFCFAAASELTHAVRYLTTYDDTIKFVLVYHGGGGCTLRVTVAHVPPLSFSVVVYDNCVAAPGADCGAAARTAPFAPPLVTTATTASTHKVCWAVDARTLVRVLATFDASSPVVVEVCDGGAAMLLYQRASQSHCTRLARLNVLYDVSPELLVSHHVEQLYRIGDVRSFRDACVAVACDAASAATTPSPATVPAMTRRRARVRAMRGTAHRGDNNNDDHDDSDGSGDSDNSNDGAEGEVLSRDVGGMHAAAQCRVTLHRRRSGECELVCETDTVRATVRLCDAHDGGDAAPSAQGSTLDSDDDDGGDERLCGLLRCADLRAFARLCHSLAAPSSPVRRKGNAAHVCIGFADNDVALLRLQWFTESGERTASLYFCRIPAE